MRVYVIIPNLVFHDWSRRVGALHFSIYHGFGDYRTLVEWVPRPGVNEKGEHCAIGRPPDWRWPAVTNVNRESLHVTRSGRFLPPVFGSSFDFLIVSQEVQKSLARLPHVGFSRVVFEQLVDLSMPPLGDFSWFERPDIDTFEADPDNLLRSLPHDPAFEPRVAGYRQLLPALFDDLAPRYNDVETRPVEFGSYAHATSPKQVRLSREMLKEYPIVLSERYLFREDAFALLAPFLDLDYYSIAVLTVRK